MVQMRLGVLPVMMANTTPRTLVELLRYTRRYIKERAKQTMAKPSEHHPSDASDEAQNDPSYYDQHDTQTPRGDIDAALPIFISRIFYI